MNAESSVAASVMLYSPNSLREFEPWEDLSAVPTEVGHYFWVNVDGLSRPSMVEELGKLFGFHPLAIEDVLRPRQRPKVEVYGPHLFIVVRMLCGPTASDTEQLSIFLTAEGVVTFQEVPGDRFDRVRDRLRKGYGIMRSRKPDYLTYSLLDTVIDEYFPLLERIGEDMEELEDEIMSSENKDLPFRVRRLRSELLQLRRVTWPLREVVNILIRDPSPLISEETKVYLRDCYDHVTRIMDLIESHREVASDLMDLFLSRQNTRMNDTMKILTMFSSIFIPLNFLAGLYGMNFHTEASPFNMPELDWYLGYPAVLTLMAATALTMLLFFKRKGWL